MRTRGIVLVLAVALIGCGPTGEAGGNNNGGGGDGSTSNPDASVFYWDSSTGIHDAQPAPNWDAFFAADPPPQYCGPGSPDAAVLPGGTPECPDDKNREGCPCAPHGATAPCWPGLRVDRNRGICQDGVTTCLYFNEFVGQWGPCEGYVLPVPGATLGPQACNCFSMGSWEIDNLSPCFVTYNGNQIYAVSTFDAGGGAQCPTNLPQNPPPNPEPGYDWSANRLNVDCAGQFELCYTLRAGDENNPDPVNDCVVVSVCVDAWYDTPGVVQDLPNLPGWTSSNTTCAAQFANSGGYGEMSVVGLSVECEDIDDNGSAYIFHRIGYCPLSCNTNPSAPECQNCGNGGSGSF
ncbi:MAG: hypothetical protein ABI333_00230 [bacterium]